MFTFSQYSPDHFFLNFSEGDLQKWKQKNSVPFDSSFYHVWNKRKKNIIYIALVEKKIKNTSSMLNKIFKSKNLDIALLPNIDNEEGVNPSLNLEDISLEEKEIIDIIKKYNVPYIGYIGDDETFIKIALKKFLPKDILLFMFLFLYQYCEKNLKKDVKFFSQMIKDIMPNYQKFVEKEEREEKLGKLNYNELFKNYYGFYFNYGVTSVKLIKPNKDSKYSIKLLSYLHMVENNKFTLKILFKHINEYNNIVIIGKQEDYYIQKDVLSEEFGKGNIYI
jgi:hypothetical protein